MGRIKPNKRPYHEIPADAVTKRREQVMHLRLRQFTQNDIVAALVKLGVVNPVTNEPYDQATISRDLKWLREESLKQAMLDADTLRAQQLAEIQEVKRAAWTDNELGIVVRCLEREAKLLGLDAPIKVENDDWEATAKKEIQAGRLTFVALAEMFDETIARRLFAESGLSVPPAESHRKIQ